MENDIIIDNPIDCGDILNATTDTTLAQTDEVIPAPLEPVSQTLTPENTPVTEPGEENLLTFFGTIQECVSIAWRFHLKTKKHHIHIALHEFYTKALYTVDNIIEIYQGIHGVVDGVFTNNVVGDGKTETMYLQELKDYVNRAKHFAGCESEIVSAIDDFLALIDTTLYKITAFTESKIKSFNEFCYEKLDEAYYYDRFGERSSDDEDDEDFDPELAEEE